MAADETAAPLPIDWADVVGLALARLSWSPAVFWAATPAELRLALRGFNTASVNQGMASPLNRRELNALQIRFPDR